MKKLSLIGAYTFIALNTFAADGPGRSNSGGYRWMIYILIGLVIGAVIGYLYGKSKNK